MSSRSLLNATEKHLARGRLPIVRESHLYPTEASVELEELKLDGTPKVIGSCIRAAFYRYKGGFAGQPYSPYTLWIFEMGKIVEKMLIENWKQMGVWIDNSVRFYNAEYNISGELDAILCDEVTGEPYIVEVKSFAGYEATKTIVGNKSVTGGPKDAHLLQTIIYLYLHRETFKQAKIIYLDKTSLSNNAEFTLTLTVEGQNTYVVINGIVNRKFAVEQIFERYRKLQVYLANDELPPRDFELTYSDTRVEQEWETGNISKSKYEKWQKGKQNIGDWNCGYCKYKEECWGIKVEEETNEE